MAGIVYSLLFIKRLFSCEKVRILKLYEGGACRRFSYKRGKVALKESIQNVSRSGEKGGPFALANGGK